MFIRVQLINVKIDQKGQIYGVPFLPSKDFPIDDLSTNGPTDSILLEGVHFFQIWQSPAEFEVQWLFSVRPHKGVRMLRENPALASFSSWTETLGAVQATISGGTADIECDIALSIER
ncbi:MAG: hypothetical protein ACN6OP_29350 [Pseudomonadales bacterium]